MSNLYPLKFKTIYKDKIWGGNKIKTILEKDFAPLPNCGETWELSGYGDEVSFVQEGALKGKLLTTLIEDFQGQLVGEKVYERFGNEFPLLIKFIDANADLSIQVHPDDVLAKTRHDVFGKTEMWYILQADEGATLISGFNQEIDKATYLNHFNNGTLDEILNREEVGAGDVFFIPAGRVHTIGKGILLAEIQQTSDTTYRIYDFDRVDAEGNKRELHVEEAVDAIDYNCYDGIKTKYADRENESVNLADCNYFTTNKIVADRQVSRSYEAFDSFVIYICIEGDFGLIYNENELTVRKGEVVLLPATIKNVVLVPSPTATILEVYIK